MTTNIRNLEVDTCTVCNTPTDQCCSLCRKVFYCSA